MPPGGEAEPTTMEWVRDQVDKIERSGGTEGTTMRGMPVIVVTNRGRKSGKLRKIPLMRVEHDGKCAAVASLGGAPKNPVWYYNLKEDPKVQVQDGTTTSEYVAREIEGEEYELWWKRSVAAYPDYAEYQKKTTRVIPQFVLEPAE